MIIVFNIEDPQKISISLAYPSPLHPNIYLCRCASLCIEKEAVFSYFPREKKLPKNIVKENCLSHNMKSVSYLE